MAICETIGPNVNVRQNKTTTTTTTTGLTYEQSRHAVGITVQTLVIMIDKGIGNLVGAHGLMDVSNVDCIFLFVCCGCCCCGVGIGKNRENETP
jgi:hypothetical protein